MKKLTHYIFIFIVLAINFGAIAQPGYMGRKNIVGVGGNFHPNFTKFGGSQTFIAVDLNLEYERVITRKLSLGLEYNLQSYRLPTNGKRHTVQIETGFFNSELVDSYFNEDFSMFAHHFDLNFHMYSGEGSIAPYGSFFTYQVGIVKSKAVGETINKRIADDIIYSSMDADIAPVNITLVHFGFELMNKRSIGTNFILKYGMGTNIYFNTSFSRNFENGYLMNILAGAFRQTFQSNIGMETTEPNDAQEHASYIERGAFARLMALNILNFKVVLELPF